MAEVAHDLVNASFANIRECLLCGAIFAEIGIGGNTEYILIKMGKYGSSDPNPNGTCCGTDA